MSRIDAYICNVCKNSFPLYNLYEVAVIPSRDELDKHVCAECLLTVEIVLKMVGVSCKVITCVMVRGREGNPGLIEVVTTNA